MENHPQQSAAAPYPPQDEFQHLLRQQQLQLRPFWTRQRQEIKQVNDFKDTQLSVTRIKNIMKADQDVKMISAEAPILFAKACELFILELTTRSWNHAVENKRQTIQKNDIAAVIRSIIIFDFLEDIVPTDEIKDEAAPVGAGSVTRVDPGVYAQPAWGGLDPGVYAPPEWGGLDPGVYAPLASGVWEPAAEDGSSGSSSGQGLALMGKGN